jgi:hypothetical protein
MELFKILVPFDLFCWHVKGISSKQFQNLVMLNLGAGVGTKAASQYGSGSTKMRRIQFRNTSTVVIAI